MTIPAQNEFFLPFLNLLSNGKRLPRSQIMFQLAKHFNINEEQAQAMSGNQFTLVNRVAWCDVHLVGAGFVEKEPNPTDSMNDEFVITPLGVHELNRRPDKLSVGYLRNFYIGKVNRGSGSHETNSDGEITLLKEFGKLPDPFVVFHAVKWIAHSTGTVGEVDFLIAHPDYGVLVLEVKAGAVRIINGEWFSGQHKINDPCKQSDRNRWALVNWWGDDASRKRIPVAFFPAVALPNARVDGHIRPDCTEDIFIDRSHMDDLENRLLSIFRYWKKHADTRNAQMGGAKAIDALKEFLLPTRRLQPSIIEQFAQENRQIDQLTTEQYRVLDFLRFQERAAILGGAGTGKTLLAMEKALRLADEGLQVLFVCFNRNLQSWVSKRLGHQQNIQVLTFHSMAGKLIQRTLGTNFRNQREFSEQVAELLFEATEILHAREPEILFDAVIVDEGQDFEDDWWVGLLNTLKSPDEGILYVFFDDNQKIFGEKSEIPIHTHPLYLSENLRNTQHIHARLMSYTTDTKIKSLGPEGRPVEIIPVADTKTERRELQRVLNRLVNEEGIPIEDIIILTPNGERKSHWKKDDQLGNFILSWDLQTTMPMAGRISTIHSFKGLESAVVILTELHSLQTDVANKLLYVGLSRARHHAIIMGDISLFSINT